MFLLSFYQLFIKVFFTRQVYEVAFTRQLLRGSFHKVLVFYEVGFLSIYEVGHLVFCQVAGSASPPACPPGSPHARPPAGQPASQQYWVSRKFLSKSMTVILACPPAPAGFQRVEPGLAYLPRSVLACYLVLYQLSTSFFSSFSTSFFWGPLPRSFRLPRSFEVQKIVLFY